MELLHQDTFAIELHGRHSHFLLHPRIMRTISFDHLQGIPKEARDLIGAGIYALYALKPGSAAYLLVTDHGEKYFLDSDGSILASHRIDNIREAIDDVVVISDPSPQMALLNCR
jgi:hypothetical protein